MTGRLVVIESPYAGDVPANLAYLHQIIRECALRDDSPYASHLMLTEALDDLDTHERAVGIELGLRWRRAADARLFYIDRGWSPGMLAAKALYVAEGLSFEIRVLGETAFACYPVPEGGE